jgi:hypothetical protein
MAIRKMLDIAFPIFLLRMAYRRYLTGGLGEMVFNALNDLVNNAVPRLRTGLEALSAYTMLPS